MLPRLQRVRSPARCASCSHWEAASHLCSADNGSLTRLHDYCWRCGVVAAPAEELFDLDAILEFKLEYMGSINGIQLSPNEAIDSIDAAKKNGNVAWRTGPDDEVILYLSKYGVKVTDKENKEVFMRTVMHKIGFVLHYVEDSNNVSGVAAANAIGAVSPRTLCFPPRRRSAPARPSHAICDGPLCRCRVLLFWRLGCRGATISPTTSTRRKQRSRLQRCASV